VDIAKTVAFSVGAVGALKPVSFPPLVEGPTFSYAMSPATLFRGGPQISQVRETTRAHGHVGFAFDRHDARTLSSKTSYLPKECAHTHTHKNSNRYMLLKTYFCLLSRKGFNCRRNLFFPMRRSPPLPPKCKVGNNEPWRNKIFPHQTYFQLCILGGGVRSSLGRINSSYGTPGTVLSHTNMR